MYMYVCLLVCICVLLCVHTCACLPVYAQQMCTALGGQKRVLDILELQLQVVVSHLMWVLETKLRSSTRTINALNL